MSDSSYSHRHYSDHHRRSDRDYRHHDHRGHRDRDSRDSYRTDYSNQRRVPGLVSDPDTQLGDAERAIQRGQRETIQRYQSDRYSPSKGSKVTKDTMTPPAYRPVVTVSQPFYQPSKRQNYNYKKSRRLPINPVFLSFFPGLTGFGLLIAAIVIINWIVTVITPTTGFNIEYEGLFQVCTTSLPDDVTDCKTVENFNNSGSAPSDLKQAARAMIIIAAIFAFASVVVSFVFGLNKLEREKGAYIVGGLYAFSGACAVAAMGCYSAALVDDMSSAAVTNVSVVQAGASFYLGWFGTGCLLVASVISFLASCAKLK